MDLFKKFKPPPKEVVDFFSENLKSERLRLKLSQKELGELFGVSDATITMWEKKVGGSRPSPGQFLRLCAFFERTPTEMFLEILSLGGGGRASPATTESPPGALAEELESIKKRLSQLETRY